jgi:hypothetical protein
MDEAEAKKRIAFWETKKKACERKGDIDCIARADAAIARIEAAMGTSQKHENKRSRSIVESETKSNSKLKDMKKTDDKGGVI